MDLMPGEKLIWAGHPTWRATISSIVWGVLAGIAFLALATLVDRFGGDSMWTVYGVLGLLVIAGGTIKAAVHRVHDHGQAPERSLGNPLQA